MQKKGVNRVLSSDVVLTMPIVLFVNIAPSMHSSRSPFIPTLLSFALIPLSGFATDIYIPSLPAMAADLRVNQAGVQLSLVLFMVSSGVSQLFVGSLLDSFGRFRLGLLALFVFAAASFVIAASHDIGLIYVMRIVQGTTVAMIVVGKRAFFVDTYSGEQLKHYTSLFSIIWATAPIVAPFLGGYLQTSFGWRSNFYFLGSLTVIIGVLELKFGGESLKQFQQFRLRPIVDVYLATIRTVDFSLGLVIIALCYSMLVVYGMASPFIIEHVFHYSPVVTGYCSLLSGVSLMSGGIISKALIRRALLPKISTAIGIQVVAALAMIVVSPLLSNLATLMAFTVLVHMVSGFVFNNVFAYCLGRFSRNAGIASGVTGGGMYIFTSFFSYGLVSVLPIQSQALLGWAYLSMALVLVGVVMVFSRAKRRAEEKLTLAA